MTNTPFSPPLHVVASSSPLIPFAPSAMTKRKTEESEKHPLAPKSRSEKLWPPLRRPFFRILSCRPLPALLLLLWWWWWWWPNGGGGPNGRGKRSTRWCCSPVGSAVGTLMIRGWKSGPTHHRLLMPKWAGHLVCQRTVLAFVGGWCDCRRCGFTPP